MIHDTYPAVSPLREPVAARFRILGIAATVALGGFMVGFDSAVISGAVPFIRDYFGLGGADGSLKLGWAVSCLLWGAMLGNIVAGPLSDRLGRRTILLLTALLFLVSSLIAATSTSFALFVAARICGGFGVGAAILIAPVYIAEIAPAGRRGSLVSLNQLMIVIGISVSFFSNYFLLSLTGGNWRWMLGVQALPAGLYFFLLTLVPESPRWLLGRGQPQRALKILRSVQGEAESQRELAQIQASLQQKRHKVRLHELFGPRLRKVLLFGFGIAFFQQATGINAVFYYLPSIFAQAGGSLATSFGQSVLVSLVNLGMTFVAIWLIDRLGRKPLLTYGVAGMSLSLLCIAWAFHGTETGSVGHPVMVLAAIVGFVASFAVSLGPVMWVLLSEIFPNEQRAAAISVVGCWNSLISFTVTLVFPKEVASFGPSFTFLCYGLVAAAGLVFILLLAPETKGKTLEELERMLTSSSRAVT